MEFRILGPLEIRSSGQLLGVGAHKQRVLLAALLLEANRVVSSDRLIEALWEEQPPPTAVKALQLYVSHLRQLLGKERLVTKAPGYLLRVGADDELDLERFERLREQGRLRDALALWRGAPLADLAYDRFAQDEIARLEELRLVCLEERVEQDLAAGRDAELVGELEALVKEHPFRERLRAQLMLALYRAGRQAEALDAYQQARATLVEELGIDPGRQLRELHQSMLRQDPALDLRAAGAEAAGAVADTRGIFVGREAELEELRAGLDAAIAGRGSLFLLAGEPGIGKSRLAEEVMRQAEAGRAIVLVGRCWEAGGAPAYWPWVQSLRTFVEQSEPEALRGQLAGGAVDLAQLVPELRQLFPDLPEPSAESEGARFRLFDSVERFLRNAAAVRPLVLVLDDLHAADEPSLLLLRFVAGRLGESRILVVGTYRNVDPTVRDPLGATLAELAREPVTRRVELGGLTRADVARYIDASAGALPSAPLVTAIHAETEGNPLFVGEVVRLLVAEGQFADVADGALWTLGIPQGVREVIGRRLGRLPEESKRVLTLASVIGREFGLDAVERIGDLSGDDLVEVLDEAVEARLLTSVPGARGRLRFGHALIRETLYEGLTTVRRVQLHRRVGEALESLHAPDPEPHLAELAHHFFEAAPGGDIDKALEYAQRAGERALRLLAYEEATRLYELGLQALELKHSPQPVRRCELLLSLGEAQARAGAESAAMSAFFGAAELARATGASDLLAQAALGYGGRFVWGVAGIDEQVVPLLEDALRGLGDEESPLRAKVLARLAGALRDQDEPERREELSAQAVELARRCDDQSALAYALDGRYSAIWRPGNSEERLSIADEILRLAEEVGDRERAVQARFYRAFALLELGRVAAMHAELEVMERVVAELRQPAQRWYVAILGTILALLRGDFDEARAAAPQTFELAKTMHARLPHGSYVGQMFLLHREQGRVDELVDMAEQLTEAMPTMDAFRCILASVYTLLGREAEARALLKSLAERDFDVRVDNDKLFGWSLLAEVCSSLGETEHATRLYALLRPHSHLNAVCHPACAIGSVARYLGMLAATTSRWEDAAGHFEDALEMNARMGARPWLAHTQRDYAETLLARDVPGHREKAQLLLSEALTSYRQLGMETAAARAAAVLASHPQAAPLASQQAEVRSN